MIRVTGRRPRTSYGSPRLHALTSLGKTLGTCSGCSLDSTGSPKDVAKPDSGPKGGGFLSVQRDHIPTGPLCCDRSPWSLPCGGTRKCSPPAFTGLPLKQSAFDPCKRSVLGRGPGIFCLRQHSKVVRESVCTDVGGKMPKTLGL